MSARLGLAVVAAAGLWAGVWGGEGEKFEYVPLGVRGAKRFGKVCVPEVQRDLLMSGMALERGAEVEMASFEVNTLYPRPKLTGFESGFLKRSLEEPMTFRADGAKVRAGYFGWAEPSGAAAFRCELRGGSEIKCDNFRMGIVKGATNHLEMVDSRIEAKRMLLVGCAEERYAEGSVSVQRLRNSELESGAWVTVGGDFEAEGCHISNVYFTVYGFIETEAKLRETRLTVQDTFGVYAGGRVTGEGGEWRVKAMSGKSGESAAGKMSVDGVRIVQIPGHWIPLIAGFGEFYVGERGLTIHTDSHAKVNQAFCGPGKITVTGKGVVEFLREPGVEVAGKARFAK